MTIKTCLGNFLPTLTSKFLHRLPTRLQLRASPKPQFKLSPGLTHRLPSQSEPVSTPITRPRPTPRPNSQPCQGLDLYAHTLHGWAWTNAKKSINNANQKRLKVRLIKNTSNIKVMAMKNYGSNNTLIKLDHT